MRAEDEGEFTKLLAASMLIYDRQITKTIVGLFFSAMSPYELPTVREALSRHLQDPDGGRFAPKPADLIRQIQSGKAQDGRPGRDEAWAIAQLAADESRTVVLSDEIIGALEVARPLIEMRDKVAARLAFVEAYDRLVSEKRAAAEPLAWHVSLGTDKHGRIQAIEQAKSLGRLPAQTAELMIADQCETPISADGLAIAGLLGGPAGAKPEDLRAKWQELRQQVAGKAKQDKLELNRRQMLEAEQELDRMRNDKL